MHIRPILTIDNTSESKSPLQPPSSLPQPVTQTNHQLTHTAAAPPRFSGNYYAFTPLITGPGSRCIDRRACLPLVKCSAGCEEGERTEIKENVIELIPLGCQLVLSLESFAQFLVSCCF